MYKIENNGDYVILKTEEYYINVSEILGVSETIIQDCIHINRFFRYSIDESNYSDWFELTIPMLNSILPLGENEKFWIDYKYELTDNCTFEIQSASLNVELLNPNYDLPFPLAFGWEKGSRFYPIVIRHHTFNPYAQSESIKLQKEMSLIVNNVFGLSATYIKADPEYESRDSLLHEWGLLKYRDPVHTKILVPNNAFPDNKPNFTAFGFEYEEGFEVHIDKRFFEWHFGNGQAPQKDDAIYFPINDRMYLVQSSMLHRNFMGEPLYFKLTLTKYSKLSHIDTDLFVENEINDIVTGLEKMFDKEINNEEIAVTNPMQLSDKTYYHDYVRQYNFDVNKAIVNYELVNNRNVISQNYYNFYEIYKQYGYKETVIYKPKNEEKFRNQIFTVWYRKMISKDINTNVNISNVSGNEITLSYSGSGLSVKLNSLISLTKNDVDDFFIFGFVKTYNKTAKTITIETRPDILNYANEKFPMWDTFELTAGFSIRHNLFNAYNFQNKKGYLIDLYKEGFLVVTIGQHQEIFKIGNEDKWYGLVVNLLTEYNQIGVYQYETENGTENLNQVIWEVREYNYSNTFSDLNYSIISSPIYITNIRLMSKVIPQEKHSTFLNQNLLTNSDNAILIDNVQPKLNLAFVGQIK